MLSKIRPTEPAVSSLPNRIARGYVQQVARANSTDSSKATGQPKPHTPSKCLTQCVVCKWCKLHQQEQRRGYTPRPMSQQETSRTARDQNGIARAGISSSLSVQSREHPSANGSLKTQRQGCSLPC